MTSVVDKYYRRIIQNIDNIKMKFDISSLLVKTKKHDSKINTNKNNISDNTSLIDTNKNNISDNSSKINTNTSDISNNYNFIQINKKKSDNNITFIDTNKDNIAANLNTLNNVDNSLLNLGDRIDVHQNDIQRINTNINELSGSYQLKNIIIIDIIKSNIPETIDTDNNEFVIIKYNLNNLKKDSYLQFDSSILIFFHKHYINIGFFHILLEYFNENDIIIEKIKMPIIGTISKFANITNSCIIKIPNDLDKIYYELSIKLNEGQNRSDKISILDFDNKIYFKYFEK